ncbi:MAG: DUF2244 domain-containing protein [Bradyrhizobiaceae bacterium]|nr:DUF2244 domain-containing protein [Bradyrhizobiaceae bacterium]
MSRNDLPADFTTSDPAIFSAVVTPYRSLNRTGFLIVMAAVSTISFAAGTVFLLMGAWPVFGFFGLDVLLVYWAFRVNYRAAAAYEEVTVTSGELRVRKVSHRGQSLEWTFNPLWVRLEREHHEEFGLQGLFLVSRGERVPVASVLSPQERESFATALAAAIGEARRGPTRTVAD